MPPGDIRGASARTRPAGRCLVAVGLATPKLYEQLKGEGIGYAIRLHARDRRTHPRSATDRLAGSEVARHADRPPHQERPEPGPFHVGGFRPRCRGYVV